MPFTRTLLISTNDLKNNTIIEKNLEDHVILPNIINAHTIDLQEVLSSSCDMKGQTYSFYNYLLDKVRTETTSVNENYLIDNYIIPFLIQVSLFRCLPYLWSKIENSSIVLKETENTKSLDLVELKYLRGDITKDANFLKERLIKYLCNNSTLFPQYNGSSVNSAYNNIGIFLDNGKSGIDDLPRNYFN